MLKTKRVNLFMILIFIFSLVLAGCGANKEKDDAPNLSQLEPIKVTIQLPDKIDPGQEVSLKAKVIQGKEPVEDAEEVEFEIWEGNSEEHEKIAATHEGNGVYVVKITFEKDGIYNVIAHVTARDMHSMPQQQFTVGNPTQTDQEAAESEHEHASDHGDTSENEAEHHHGHGLDIQFLFDDSITSNTDVKLSAEIKQGEQPLTGAAIQFELWKENTGESESQWVIAEEISDGIYEGHTNFKEAGSYLITVHVKKDDIHDHKEQVITVK